jgi:hypothetical protein
MSNRKFIGIFDSTPETFAVIVTIRSDGKDFSIELPDWFIPLINQVCIDHSIEALKDAFYRVRPDLRVT